MHGAAKFIKKTKQTDKEGEVFYGRIIKITEYRKKVEEQLIQVGINSVDELKKVGAKAAWLKIQEIDESACINRLMALEGAIEGVKKTMLSDEVKADLKEFYRMGRCSIKESFVTISNKGEILINHMHISPYEKGNIFNKDPLRVRKLLLHKKEILKIFGKMKEQGITVVPLQVYFSGSLVKIEIGLAKGKKLYDKRETIAKKDQKREAQREFKAFNR